MMTSVTDKAAVFVGPTLGTDLCPGDHLVYFDPAKRGDLYRVAKEQPRAIILIDGSFEGCPTVFHKEILWALSRGVHVFGSSSIGALRAAELHPFGMIGIGEVFLAYHLGTVDRDDAVAILHGPKELGWKPLTEALFDIDLTLSRAEEQGILSSAQRCALLNVASATFWKERTYERITANAGPVFEQDPLRNRLAEWLSTNRLSQKARDAVNCIEYVNGRWDALEEPFAAPFRFEQTLTWEAISNEIELESCGASASQIQELEHRLEQEGTLLQFERQALANVFAAELTHSEPEFDLEAASEKFRARRGLQSDHEFVAWVKSRHLRMSEYIEMVRQEAALEIAKGKRTLSLRLAKASLLRELGWL
jgi:hypothetical protein